MHDLAMELEVYNETSGVKGLSEDLAVFAFCHEVFQKAWMLADFPVLSWV